SCVLAKQRRFKRIAYFFSLIVQSEIYQSVYRLSVAFAFYFLCRNIQKRKQSVVCSNACVLVILRQMPNYRSHLTFNIAFLLFYLFENLIGLFLFLLGSFVQVVFGFQIPTDSH